MRWLILLLPAAVLALGLSRCGDATALRGALSSATPHERYAQSLRAAGLDATALGRAWHEAGRRALELPPLAALPHREVGFLDPAQPSAAGYRLDLRRGQHLSVQAELSPGDSAHLFVDLFRLPADTTRTPEHVAHADANGALTYEVNRDGAYVLRVQPELLRGGRFTVALQADPSLRFPVSGHASEAIRSFFGAPRDGGRRKHHGVDIFAPRGTPVVAAADGYVTRLGNRGLGGKVVWLRTARRGLNLYYAHLDSQIARPRTYVRVGDTLGLVGNTGNAIRTPPHLHFGIYQRGPVDPFPFLHQLPSEGPALAADTSRLGRWARVAGTRLNVRAGPSTDTAVLSALPRHTPLRLEGSVGAWHRVRLPDGTGGYVAARLVEPATEPVRIAAIPQGTLLRTQPSSEGLPVDSLGATSALPVLGRFDAHLLVEPRPGQSGWITAP